MAWLHCVLVAVLLPATVSPFAAPEESEIRSLIDSSQYARAEKLLLDSLRSQPDWESGHLLLGQLYLRTARFRDALSEAKAAAALHESYTASMLAARASLELKELNDSIDWLNKAAALKPDEAEIYKLLGLVYALGGVKTQSVTALNHAVRLAPANWEYHYLAGRALYDLERFDDAARELSRAIELNGASVRAWTALGQVQERTRESASAGDSYLKAVALCGEQKRECAWPLVQLGRLAEAGSITAGAEEYFRRAVEARPEWAAPHYHLGKALASRSLFVEARKELESAVALDATKAEYFYQLGQVCRQAGDAANARRYLDRFQELQAVQKSAVPMELQQP